MKMRYGSVCSGIEAATVAWHPLGWGAAWFAEIEPFPSAVLAHHYPAVPNLGDMTTIAARIRAREVEAPDILVGGTPCQSFSVAGLRGGLTDARGNLALAFVELADAIDAVRRDHGLSPAWALWENVPGVFTVDGGGAFGAVLGGLVGGDTALSPGPAGWTNAGVVAGPDRVAAWRVLDAQYFGVAQRRRRVFVLARGGARAWDAADALLPLVEGVRWHPAPSRAARAGAAEGAEIRAGERGGLPGWAEDGGAAAQALTAHPGGRYDLDTETFVPALTASMAKSRASSNDGAMLVPGIAGPLGAGSAGKGWSDDLKRAGAFVPVIDPEALSARDVALIRASRPDPLPFDTNQITSSENRSNPSPGLTAHAPPAIAFHVTQDPISGEVAPALGCGNALGCGTLGVAVEAYQCHGNNIGPAGTLRSGNGGLTGGVPFFSQAMSVRRLTPRECERLQGFPDDYTAIPGAKDGPRYRALGNSMAVPPMRHIGRGIQRVREVA